MSTFIPASVADLKVYDIITLTRNGSGRKVHFQLTDNGHLFQLRPGAQAAFFSGRWVTSDGTPHRGRRQNWDATEFLSLASVVSVQRRDSRVQDVETAAVQAWRTQYELDEQAVGVVSPTSPSIDGPHPPRG